MGLFPIGDPLKSGRVGTAMGEGDRMSVCISCGRSNAEIARFCQVCGTPIPETVSPAPVPQPAVGAVGIRYAGFWIRFVAVIIDSVFVGLLMGVVALISGPGFPLGLIVPWLYEALMLSSEPQATLGKMALGITVTDVYGQRLTFGRATGRHFAKFLSAFLFGIGFIMAAFTARKQALHDLIAGTVALRS